MIDWVTVSRTDHAAYGYLPLTDYRFTQGLLLAPLLVSELTQALPHYVLAFVKRNNEFHLVVLLGQRKSGHLYLHPDGRWLGEYIPAGLRGHPFRLIPTDKGDQVLQVQSGHLMEVGGEVLFDGQGVLSEPMQRRLEFLKQCEINRQTTQRGCKALADAGVLVEWDEGKPESRAKGLYRFDEISLNKLDPVAFHALRGVPLAIAYAQMFSMTQVSQLAMRARLLNEHEQRNAGALPNDPSAASSLDFLFKGNDEDISFY